MSEQRSEVERDAEDRLRDLGIAITEENPEHKQGNMTVYSIVGKKLDTEHEYEVFGDSRENALKSLLVLAKAR